MKIKESFVAGVLVLNVMVVLGIVIFLMMLASPSAVKDTKPFIHQVDEIAADGQYFYTLDNTLHNICKYTNDGEFQYTISFPSHGLSYLLINEEGNLCRYDLRKRLLFVYDSDGSLLSEEALPYENFEIIRDTKFNDSVTANGVEYLFQNRLVLNSSVAVINTQKQTANVVVETLWGHAVLNGTIVAFLAGIAYSVYQFSCHFIKEKVGFNNRNEYQ